MIRDESVDAATGVVTVREWDPDTGDTATVTAFDAQGEVISTEQVDVSEERAALLAQRAAETDRAQVKAALDALTTAIDRGSQLTNAQVRDLAVLLARIARRMIRDQYQG